MFIGHLGLALAARRHTPGLSLGALFLATLGPDLLWSSLLLAGVERVRVVPGHPPLVYEHYPLSHSLLGVLAGAAALAGLLALRGPRREALVGGALVVSHWVLDAVTHVPDLPLLPWGGPLVGLGACASRPLEALLEGGLLLAGAWRFPRAPRPREGLGTWGLAALIGFLGLAALGRSLGPAPPGPGAVAWTGHLQWLLVLAGFRMDRVRQARRPEAP